MVDRYYCPSCHTEIHIFDVNFMKDIARCPSCRYAMPFSTLIEKSEINLDVLTQTPPKSVQINSDISSRTTKITYRHLSPFVLFLTLALTFTVVFSICFIYGRQLIEGKFIWQNSLLGLPLLLATIVLLYTTAFLIFGKWIITLEQGNGTVFAGIGSVGWTRRFTYNRDSMVALKLTHIELNKIPQKGIVITTGSKEIVFGTLFRDEAKKYIVAELTKIIRL